MIFPEMFKTLGLFFILCALPSCSNYKNLSSNESVSSKTIPASTILNSSDSKLSHTKPLDLTYPTLDFSSKSRFQPIPWNNLPGFNETSTSILWSALLVNCEKPHPIWTSSCSQMRPLSLADDQEQRIWILSHLQAFSVEGADGEDTGLLTSYYEPVFKASFTQRDSFNYPIYSPPPSLLSSKKLGQPWFNRKEIETSPTLQKELQNQVIAWLQDPLDVMILHVQGSARLQIENTTSQTIEYRVGFAASNDLPYQSMAKWIIEQGLGKDTSWPGIKSALLKYPDKEKEAFWSNPRYIFFALSPLNDTSLGPKGSWGKPLKSKLSVAVDPKSIPLGLPLWLSSEGSARFQQIALSEDTGNAINGSIRVDYFAGTGPLAGEFANKIKQNLKLWVLLPRKSNP
jgi:membrane-bound lytic murein transglycosylase A